MVKDWCVLCCDLRGKGIKYHFYLCLAALSQGPWRCQGLEERLRGAGRGLRAPALPGRLAGGAGRQLLTLSLGAGRQAGAEGRGGGSSPRQHR